MCYEKIKIIEYKGKTFKTKTWCEITEKERINLKEEYFKKPDIKEVVEELEYISSGTIKVSNIKKYFFRDIQSKVVVHSAKWSIEDVFESNDILGHFIKQVEKLKGYFEENESISNKMDTVFRLAGIGVAKKPTNFPISQVRKILYEYNINNNYYDYSCGWGDRLLGSLSCNINYFGTDPNYLLTPRLKELGQLFLETNYHKNATFDVKCQGSELFIPEYEDKMGVAFSSPPYFLLEDYKIGKQSCNENTNYEDWLNDYWKNTVINIEKYLINEGTLLVNIKPYKKYDLYNDTMKICIDNGFYLYDEIDMKNISRKKSGSKELVENDEKIMVLKKNSNCIEKNDFEWF